MAAAEVNLIIGKMPDSSDSSRHNLLYLLQNFALYSTATCPDLYFSMLRKLVITFQDQLNIRWNTPSFLFACQVPMPEITFPWPIKQEEQQIKDTIYNHTIKKKVTFSTEIVNRRKAIIKKNHKCKWCKKSYKYLQKLQKHKEVCYKSPKTIVKRELDADSTCNSQQGTKSLCRVKQEREC